MEDEHTLAIIVKSDRYFDYVVKLADAAISKGKKVLIHMIGPGVAFLHDPAFACLSRFVETTVCEPGACVVPEDRPRHVPDAVKIVSPTRLSEILNGCDRYIVF